MKLEVSERRLRFAQPLETAYGTLRERALALVTITAADGARGYGEAAPLEPYDGVTLAAVRDALDAYARVLEGVAELAGVPEVVASCREVAALPQALAAIDLALWDMAGRRAGVPVSQRLAAAPATAIDVNASVGAVTPDAAADAAAEAARAGYRTIKLKVGTPHDTARVAAVRAAAGPELALRLDANGAWDVDTAVRAIGELEPFGLELVEEPVHGVEDLRAVRDRVSVPVAMDETAAQPGAASSGATDAVCLKIGACGGIAALLERAAQARATGADVYVASTYDGPLGVAAGLHAAAALAPQRACGLATLDLFADLEAHPFSADRGRMAVPRDSGLGVTPFG